MQYVEPSRLCLECGFGDVQKVAKIIFDGDLGDFRYSQALFDNLNGRVQVSAVSKTREVETHTVKFIVSRNNVTAQCTRRSTDDQGTKRQLISSALPLN